MSSIAKLRAYVKEVNCVLDRCGKEKLNHSSGYAKTKAEQDALESIFTEEERQKVQDAHDAYMAAKGAGKTAGADPTPPKQQWRMNGRGFMLTYNKKNWGCEPLPLFSEFLAFLRALVASLGFSKWTATCEKSLKSKDDGRIHLHAYVEAAQSVDEALDDRFAFKEVHPRADKCFRRWSTLTKCASA